jgi:formylglycine-generating enzyme required for sulfatase activity
MTPTSTTQKIITLDLLVPSKGKNLDLINVNPGTFLMGYSSDENLELSDRSFEVEISKKFWFGKYLITQAQWQEVMNENPSEFIGNNLPVTNISWDEVQVFCDKLNMLCSTHIPNGYKLQLPTEAQWEYACRADTKSKNYGGDEIDDILRIAWCKENSSKNLQEVGLKEPNSWGFYDMFGNIFEWCFDMIVDYPEGKMTDWIGIDNNEYLGAIGLDRVVRGGCYLTPCQSDCFDAATRNYISPDTKDSCYGFRLCLAPTRSL